MKRVLLLIALLIAVPSGAWLVFQHAYAERPNVILIVLDTLRADHLGTYGYERDTTPHLDAFAKESLVFEYAITSAPWTPPAVGSMFTGLYASAHGMMPPNSRGLARQSSAVLDEKNLCLAEILKAYGYQTVGITPNPWIKGEFGYSQGFDSYYYRDRARADEINRAADKVLNGVSADNPFFLFLHYLDPHDPYDPPSPYDKKFTGALQAREYDPETLEKLNRYDGEIAFLDDNLGSLFQNLKGRGLWENSVIVIISDHGEQFRERGELGHGFRLYDEEAHVVLFVKAPGIEPRRVSHTVSTIDVLPTILDLTGSERLPNLLGQSLVDGESLARRTGVLSEIDRKHNWKSFTNQKRDIVILDFEPEQPALVGVFNSTEDPLQIQPKTLLPLQQELQGEFDLLYGKISENQIETNQVEIKSDTLDQLKSLGYMK